MIRFEAVVKRFGAVPALGPVDIDIRRGERVGLFGHNGSGKTTLLRILLGLSAPTSGRVLIDGAAPGRREWEAFRRRLGFMPEHVLLYEHLTGGEMLGYFARLRGVDADVLAPLLERVGLAAAADRRIGEYSKGMRQRLNLAQALLGEPEILILDEPLEGLDPQGVRDVFDLLRAGNVETVVISSHRLSEVSSEVDRVYILRDGVVKAQGSVEELLRSLVRPVRIHIYPAAALNGTFERVLRELGAVQLTSREGALVAEVAQEQKTAFLLGLHAHRHAIRHLHVEEPSLEGVYFETR